MILSLLRHAAKTLFLLFFLIVHIQSLSAQSQDTAIRAVVDKLFDGMRSGDSSAVSSVFVPQSTLTSVSANAKDSVMTHLSTIEEFAAAAGKPHAKKWDERIYDVRILSDGPMAIVWAPYKFYLGDTFSHCGVNVFTLIRTAQDWKINTITDTRRKNACP